MAGLEEQVDVLWEAEDRAVMQRSKKGRAGATKVGAKRKADGAPGRRVSWDSLPAVPVFEVEGLPRGQRTPRSPATPRGRRSGSSDSLSRLTTVHHPTPPFVEEEGTNGAPFGMLCVQCGDAEHSEELGAAPLHRAPCVTCGVLVGKHVQCMSVGERAKVKKGRCDVGFQCFDCVGTLVP